MREHQRLALCAHHSPDLGRGTMRSFDIHAHTHEQLACWRHAAAAASKLVLVLASSWRNWRNAWGDRRRSASDEQFSSWGIERWVDWGRQSGPREAGAHRGLRCAQVRAEACRCEMVRGLSEILPTLATDPDCVCVTHLSGSALCLRSVSRLCLARAGARAAHAARTLHFI